MTSCAQIASRTTESISAPIQPLQTTHIGPGSGRINEGIVSGPEPRRGILTRMRVDANPGGWRENAAQEFSGGTTNPKQKNEDHQPRSFPSPSESWGVRDAPGCPTWCTMRARGSINSAPSTWANRLREGRCRPFPIPVVSVPVSHEGSGP